jgi:hypothetical protein
VPRLPVISGDEFAKAARKIGYICPGCIIQVRQLSRARQHLKEGGEKNNRVRPAVTVY